MTTVLIVDDERNIRRTFSMVLGSEGFEVVEAASGEEALERVAEHEIDLVILDVKLPGIDGLETLCRLQADQPDLPVVMISGHASIATAVAATREGALDFLEKPCSREKVILAVRNGLRLRALDREVKTLRGNQRERQVMIGGSSAMEAIREQIAVAAPTSARILICGESGTGKELVARALHEGSVRADGPFIRVNCAAIPEELIESELFGAVKGSYTGATESRDGKFLQADGGTLFLDEVGDMSLKAQAKVLRALQEGEIEKVGGSGAVQVDVRVLAATNRDLENEVRAGRFREDLFFRLNVVPVMVQPLRYRRDDVPLLAEYFLHRYCAENGLPSKDLHPDVLNLLRDMPWPGNVRELNNAVERLAIMAPGPLIQTEDLRRTGLIARSQPGPGSEGVPRADALQALSPAAVQALGGLVEARRRFEAATIAACLGETDGNVSRAARLLGIDRTNLHKKIQAYGLDKHPTGLERNDS